VVQRRGGSVALADLEENSNMARILQQTKLLALSLVFGANKCRSLAMCEDAPGVDTINSRLHAAVSDAAHACL
jgi:hypothetical protein